MTKKMKSESTKRLNPCLQTLSISLHQQTVLSHYFKLFYRPGENPGRKVRATQSAIPCE